MTTCTAKLELGSCARALYDWEGSELQHLDDGIYSQLSRSDSLLLTLFCSVLFCSLAVLDPRVGHTVDVLSPFISVILTDSSMESPVHVFMCVAFLAFVHLALFLALSLSPGNSHCFLMV